MIWMVKIDFHVHTRDSIDSLIEPRHLAAMSEKLKIIPAICDHNTIAAHAKMHSSGAAFLPGEEILTERGDLIGLYLSEAIKKKTRFSEALDLIHDQGGLSYLPHMFDITRKGAGEPPKESWKRIDIVEAFNARCVLQSYNQKAEAFAKKSKIPIAAGSDSHFLFEFGKTYTNLPDLDASDLEDPKSLLRALKSRSCSLVKHPAPFYIRGTTKAISIVRKISRKLKGA